ncbi:hypothetical protein DFH11DRAFT_1878700 [Phellopilus nigrolimitatus]|nr:hypothetical protein DFH11DRAFT_1878700 [Phellopilus nigrolimitatus]
MASWFDIIAFSLTIAAFIAAIFGVKFIRDQISNAVSSTKESLKTKGYTISDKGVSVRTSKRLNREGYLDATQRGFIKAMGASSFKNSDNIDAPSAPVLGRHDSNASVSSNGSAHSGEEKRKHRFSLKKGART